LTSYTGVKQTLPQIALVSGKASNYVYSEEIKEDKLKVQHYYNIQKFIDDFLALRLEQTFKSEDIP
jgi:hypothetical protein